MKWVSSKTQEIRWMPPAEWFEAAADSGLAAMAAISNDARLAAYPFHSAAHGELELRRGNRERAREHFQTALRKARNSTERRFFEQRLAACERPNAHLPDAVFWDASFDSDPSRMSDLEKDP